MGVPSLKPATRLLSNRKMPRKQGGRLARRWHHERAMRPLPPRATAARWLVVLLLLGACTRAIVTTPPVPARLGTEETGLASWYGAPHHGRPTASGEVYDMRDLTAAHRTLPLGTRLMVTNLDNGQVVEVRVNDRGPFVQGRILDLSYGAARLIGAIGSGVIPVRLRVIALPGDAPTGTGPVASSRAFS